MKKALTKRIQATESFKRKSARRNPSPESFEMIEDTVNQYRHDISKSPLLTAAEEIKLAKAMSAGRRARSSLRRHPSATQRARLNETIRRGENARRKLVQANTRLVLSIARKYRHWGVPIADLIQEGNLGLIHAADKFDYRRGFKFSTYATWWIRQSITRAIAEQGRLIRLPVHLWEKTNRVTRVEQELEQTLGRQPTAEEIAAEIGTSPQKIVQLERSSQHPLSLEMPVGEEGNTQLGEVLADEIATDPFEAASRNMLREELDTALALLNPREERIVQLRFGLRDGRPRTLDEIGEELGFTRERIRQIEVEALRKLRNPGSSGKWQGYLAN